MIQLGPLGRNDEGRRDLSAGEAATPANLYEWVRGDWVDLRIPNVAHRVERFRQIVTSTAHLSGGDTSSRYDRNRAFWHKLDIIQLAKVVAWILSDEEGGWRMKR